MLQFLAPVLINIIPKIKLKGLGEEDRFFLHFAIKAMTLCTMLMYTPTIPAEVKANLPFVTFVDSPADAIAMAETKYRTETDALIFPHGGSTYPIHAFVTVILCHSDPLILGEESLFERSLDVNPLTGYIKFPSQEMPL